MDYLKVEDFRHEKKINAIVYQFDRKSQDDSAADNQCDQMARLFVKYLAIQCNDSLPNSKKYLPNKFIALPNTKQLLKKWPKTF